MFTGLIESVGRVSRVDVRDHGSRRIAVNAPGLDQLPQGASVAVNGVCQTVVSSGRDWFVMDTLEQSIEKTNLGRLAVGDPVNLERAMSAQGRFDGHLVQGHVEATVPITDWHQQGSNWYLGVRIPPEKLCLCISEGSICLDGMSLTIARLLGDQVICNIIPHTRENSTLAHRRIGDLLNLETDLVGRYLQRFAQMGRGGAL